MTLTFLKFDMRHIGDPLSRAPALIAMNQEKGMDRTGFKEGIEEKDNIIIHNPVMTFLLASIIERPTIHTFHDTEYLTYFSA